MNTCSKCKYNGLKNTLIRFSFEQFIRPSDGHSVSMLESTGAIKRGMEVRLVDGRVVVRPTAKITRYGRALIKVL